MGKFGTLKRKAQPEEEAVATGLKKKAKKQRAAGGTVNPSPGAAKEAKGKAKVEPPPTAAPVQDSDDDDEPAPEAEATAKAATHTDGDGDKGAAPPKKPAVDGPGSKDGLTVFVGGIPFHFSPARIKSDFSQCGDIERCFVPQWLKGIAFITFTTKAAVDKAVAFDGTVYNGKTIRVNIPGRNKERNSEKTVYIDSLPFRLSEARIEKEFGECGEIEKLTMPKNKQGMRHGIAFIEYKTKAGFEAALKLSGREYGSRTINVRRARDGKNAKGTDGRGKDGAGRDQGKGREGAPAGGAGAKKALPVPAEAPPPPKKEALPDPVEAPPPKKRKKGPQKKAA